MATKPIRVFYSPLTGTFYATRSYDELPNGNIKVTGEKFDVTQDIAGLITQYGIVFTAQPHLEVARPAFHDTVSHDTGAQAPDPPE